MIQMKISHTRGRMTDWTRGYITGTRIKNRCTAHPLYGSIGLEENSLRRFLAKYTCARFHASVFGQIYMRKIPRVTSTSCAESSGTVVAPGDHRSREHGAGRGTAQ